MTKRIVVGQGARRKVLEFLEPGDLPAPVIVPGAPAGEVASAHYEALTSTEVAPGPLTPIHFSDEVHDTTGRVTSKEPWVFEPETEGVYHLDVAALVDTKADAAGECSIAIATGEPGLFTEIVKVLDYRADSGGTPSGVLHLRGGTSLLLGINKYFIVVSQDSGVAWTVVGVPRSTWVSIHKVDR